MASPSGLPCEERTTTKTSLSRSIAAPAARRLAATVRAVANARRLLLKRTTGSTVAPNHACKTRAAPRASLEDAFWPKQSERDDGGVADALMRTRDRLRGYTAPDVN